MRSAIGTALSAQLSATYNTLTSKAPYSPDAASAGKRALKNLCLAYLMETGTAESCALVFEQFSAADNMTERGTAPIGIGDRPYTGRALVVDDPSEAFELIEPGDVVITGTPEGVILGMAEKRWMVPGDVVEVEVDGLGKLRNRMVAG